jgi:hypothetical protein
VLAIAGLVNPEQQEMADLHVRRTCLWETMSTKELKEAIQQQLDDVPPAILEEVLEFLREFQAKTPEEQKRIVELRRILHEKRDLLLRLAQ